MAWTTGLGNADLALVDAYLRTKWSGLAATVSPATTVVAALPFVSILNNTFAYPVCTPGNAALLVPTSWSGVDGTTLIPNGEATWVTTGFGNPYGSQLLGLHNTSSVTQTLVDVPTNVPLLLELVASYRTKFSSMCPDMNVYFDGGSVMSTANVLSSIAGDPTWKTFTVAVSTTTAAPTLSITSYNATGDRAVFLARLRLLPGYVHNQNFASPAQSGATYVVPTNWSAPVRPVVLIPNGTAGWAATCANLYGSQFLGLQMTSAVEQTLADVPTSVSLTLELVACYRPSMPCPAVTVYFNGAVVMNGLAGVVAAPTWNTFSVTVSSTTRTPVLRIETASAVDATLFVAQVILKTT